MGFYPTTERTTDGAVIMSSKVIERLRERLRHVAAGAADVIGREIEAVIGADVTGGEAARLRDELEGQVAKVALNVALTWAVREGVAVRTEADETSVRAGEARPARRHSRAEIVLDELEGVLEMQGQGVRAVRRSLQLHSYSGDEIRGADVAGLGDLLEHAIEALEEELRRVWGRLL